MTFRGFQKANSPLYGTCCLFSVLLLLPPLSELSPQNLSCNNNCAVLRFLSVRVWAGPSGGRETDRWLKRWCQLKRYSPGGNRAGDTGPALFYFKKKADREPSKVRCSATGTLRIFDLLLCLSCRPSRPLVARELGCFDNVFPRIVWLSVLGIHL